MLGHQPEPMLTGIPLLLINGVVRVDMWRWHEINLRLR